MSFDTESDAFRAFAKSSPTNCALLPDTTKRLRSIKNAIGGEKWRERGERLSAVRIDSGDLARLSKETRKAFDEAGLPYIKISFQTILTSTPSSRSLLRGRTN